MISKLINISERINPIFIDNNLIINKICVILPKGTQGRINLRNVGTYEPVINIAVGVEQMQKHLYLEVKTQPTNLEGYLEIFEGASETNKAVVSMISNEEFSTTVSANGN